MNTNEDYKNTSEYKFDTIQGLTEQINENKKMLNNIKINYEINSHELEEKIKDYESHLNFLKEEQRVKEWRKVYE